MPCSHARCKAGKVEVAASINRENKQPFLPKVLQGTTPHIENSTELEKLVDKLRADADTEQCLMMWTAYADRELNELIVYCESNPKYEKLSI